MTGVRACLARASDWVGFSVFAALASLALMQASTTTLLLLPTVAYETLVAVSFLIRDPLRASLPHVHGRIVAHAATFFLLLGVPLLGRVDPEWTKATNAQLPAAIGWGVWFVGSVLVGWPAWYLRHSFSIEPQARRLITTGPYGFVRHPVYTGYFLQYLGMALIIPTVPFAALLLAWFALMRLRMRYEEHVLEQAFPEYAEYRQRVGALCPRLARQGPPLLATGVTGGRSRSISGSAGAAVLVLMLFPFAAAAQQRAASDPAQEGWVALKERRFGDALEAFTQASTHDSRNPELHFGAGVAAYMLGQTGNAASSLERALALEPRLTEGSLLLADLLHRGGKTREAIEVLDAALKYAPGNEELTHALAEYRQDRQLHDRFYQAQGAHFTVLFEGPADEALARRAVEILEAAYWRVGGVLSTYPSQPVTVVLYTLQQFRDVTQAPEWSGGVYDGRIRVPMKGALDHPIDLERVLTHEFVHALVASIAGRNVPIWINEGLAEALEPGGREAAEAYLARTTTRLPPAALHRSFASLPTSAVRLAYAQSAVAVQRMLELRGAPAVVNLLTALGRGVPFEAAFQQAIYMRVEDFQSSLR